MGRIYRRVIASPVGRLEILSDGEYITGIDFSDRDNETENDDTKVLLEAERQLNEYFAGARTAFSVPVKAEGTDFQKSVWKTISGIRYGMKSTYKSIASAAGHRKACRAAANACGANPVPILIPCHRVVSSSGEGGYSGGIEIKRFLLELEKRTPLK